MLGLQNTIIKVEYIFTSNYLNVILNCIFLFKQPKTMLNTDTTQPPHPLSLNGNSNVGSINNVEQVAINIS